MNRAYLENCLTAFDVDYGVPVEGTDFYLSWENQQLSDVCEKFGKKYHIRPVFGTAVDLEALSNTQMVCTGDGKTYHFRLTKKDQ